MGVLKQLYVKYNLGCLRCESITSLCEFWAAKQLRLNGGTQALTSWVYLPICKWRFGLSPDNCRKGQVTYCCPDGSPDPDAFDPDYTILSCSSIYPVNWAGVIYNTMKVTRLVKRSVRDGAEKGVEDCNLLCDRWFYADVSFRFDAIHGLSAQLG